MPSDSTQIELRPENPWLTVSAGFDVYNDDLGEKRAFLSLIELERRAEAVIAPAEKWLHEDGREPWFVWVLVFDPHATYAAPPTFQSAHPGDLLRRIRNER